jgi:hypothetical protein
LSSASNVLLLPHRRLLHVDGYVGRIGEDIKDRSALLRLRDKGFDLIITGVSVDGTRDAHETLASLPIDRVGQ